MQQVQHHSTGQSRHSGGRAAALALAIGGLAGVLASSGIADAASSATVSTAKSTKNGTFLVSGNRTVYTVKPSSTACGTGCLQIWPMVVLPSGVTQPTAGSGVNAAKLGTIARSGGVLQVTYGGKPLYWFIGDKKAGQVKGNITDKWGKWSDVVTVKPAHSSSSGGSSGANSGGGGASF